MTPRRMRWMLRDSGAGDEGSALVIALLFLAIFGLLVGGILSLTQVNLKTTSAVRARASLAYTGGAAVDGAVNSVRNRPAVGTSAYDQTCFTLPAGSVNANTQVDVRCTGRAGSGTSTSPFAASASQPSQAILATSTANNADGLVLANATSARVQGPVAISHTLTVGTGSTVATSPAAWSPVTSEACTGTGTVTPAAICTSTTVPTDPATDATYPYGSSWVPNVSYPAPVTTMPTCNAHKVATFTPGTYSSLTDLSDVFTRCKGGAFWFQPGVYYFDFVDAGGAANHDWTLNDKNADIVGGTAAAGWDPPNFKAAAGSMAPYPHDDASAGDSACDPTQPGVLFVFGNDSRFTLIDGHVQLCAYSISAAEQHFAIWSPAATITVVGGTASVNAGINPTDVTAGAGAHWTNPENGSVIGGQLAKVVANATPSTLAMQAGSWTAPVNIPTSATVTSVTMSVYDTLGALSGTGFGKSTLKVTPGGGGAATTVTVKDCTLGCTNGAYAVNPTQVTVPMSAAQLTGITMSYSVTGAPSLAGWMDGISIVANYTAPFRAASGVLTKVPYTADLTSDGVLVVNGAAANTPVLAIHGTVYAPVTAVSITQTGVANDVVDRGIVARDIYLALSTPAAAYTGPHISIPQGATSTQPRDVLFTVVMGGVTLLRSRVVFANAAGTVDGNVPTVMTWSQQ